MTVRPSALDLYWLPLGAGASVVRWNGRLYESLHARLHRRPPADLYHAALELWSEGERYVIELTPVPSGDPAGRGVVAEGAVGSRWLGRFRVFRYELRCWRGGAIPDIDDAVASPLRLTEDPAIVRAVAASIGSVPTPVWGRDELHAGEMWNSNSVIAWLLTRAGVPPAGIVLPRRGRAPGWDAGVCVAQRGCVDGSAAASRRRRPAWLAGRA